MSPLLSIASTAKYTDCDVGSDFQTTHDTKIGPKWWLLKSAEGREGGGNGRNVYLTVYAE